MTTKFSEPSHTFLLETGMSNPRNPAEIGWRTYDEYADKDEALKEYRRLNKSGMVRVREVKTIAESLGK